MMRRLTARIGVQRWQMVQRYASSTAYMGISLVAHAAGLVILARALGTEQFGLLTLVTTGSNLGLTWCGLGSGEVLRRMVSRDVATYPQALGHALILVLSTGVFLSIVCALILARVVTASPNPWTNTLLIGMIVVSNILLFAWIGLAEQILLAHDRLTAANLVNLSSGAGRVIAVVLACLVFGVSTLEGYAYWHLGFYLILAIGCVVSVVPFGRPRGGILRDELKRGATISLAGLMIMLRKNVDVLMVNAIATPAMVGIYAVASRVVATASVVTASLDRLVYSNLARAGQAGPAATLAAASRYARYALGLCGVTVASLWIAAPLIPFVFGEAYRSAIPLVQILAGTLVLTSLHWLAVDALTAAERHTERLIVEVITGVVGVVGLIVLGRWFGMTGVLWSVYLSGALVVVGLWGVLYRLAQQQLAPVTVREAE
jgi:O-antigen/teichoic acid export membrane protein